MKKNTDALFIDVKRLAKDLYTAYSGDKDASDYIKKCGGHLRENIEKWTLKSFFTEIRPVFNVRGEALDQTLISEFITDSLNPLELEAFIAMMNKASKDILTPRMKGIIIEKIRS